MAVPAMIHNPLFCPASIPSIIESTLITNPENRQIYILPGKPLFPKPGAPNIKPDHPLAFCQEVNLITSIQQRDRYPIRI